MNRKMSKRQKDIKSKLMAAVAMLLVSSIMMVSTTYAWFTLSTAPEVTGISTAVGANGNLEMALLPVYGNELGANQDYGITSGTEDSMAIENKSNKEANITWGNLVDLNDHYGLEDVTLYPSAINTNIESGKIVPDTAFLKIPKYGTDGRIAELEAIGMAGAYNEDDEKAYQTVEYALPGGGSGETSNPAGVRLIGTASGMTDQQLDFRKAISAGSTAANNANETARIALDTNGDALGKIAIKYMTDEDNAKFNDTDKQALSNVVNALKGTETQKGSLQYIEDSLRHYIYAYQISIDPDYKTKNIEDAIFGAEGAAVPALEDLTDYMPIGMYDGDGNMLAKLQNSIDQVDEASSKLTALNGGDYSWTDLKAAMDPLMNIEAMDVNGKPVMKDGKINDEAMDAVGDALGGNGGGIILNMPSGSGVFADIADFSGRYSASIDINAKEVMPSIPFDMTVTATMNAPGLATSHLDQAKAWAQANPIQGAAEGSEAITEYYGYVLDLAFRTNAANSKLRLQTEAVDRYSDESNTEETMGGGATFIFKSDDTANGFGDERMMQLMHHMRVVFFDPADGTILAYGVPDGNMKPLADGEISVGMVLASDLTRAENAEGELEYTNLIANNDLITLEQNKLHRVSVLVYLDGTTITNKDVAIGADTSMSGRLNLQFSSSAELEPMKYSDFKTGAETGEEEEEEPVEITTGVSIVNDGATGVTLGTAGLADGKIAINLNGYTDETVTVKVGDDEAEEVEPQTVQGVTVITVDAPADFEPNTTTIVVTVTPATQGQ